MQLLWLLFPLVGLAGLVGFVWLLKVAFTRSGMWGAIVFFLSPIGATIYAVKFWEESRKPFLVYAGSVVASFALIVVSLFAVGGAAVEAFDQELARMEQEHKAPTQAKVADFDIEPAPVENRPSDLAAAAAEAEREQSTGLLNDTVASLLKPQADPVPRKRRSAFVSTGEVDAFRNQRFEVIMRDGHTFKGNYVATRGGKLEFRRTVYSGDMTLHLSPDQIKSMRLSEKRR